MTFYYEALLLPRFLLAPIIKSFHPGSKCNCLQVEGLWLSDIVTTRHAFSVNKLHRLPNRLRFEAQIYRLEGLLPKVNLPQKHPVAAKVFVISS